MTKLVELLRCELYYPFSGLVARDPYPYASCMLNSSKPNQLMVFVEPRAATLGIHANPVALTLGTGHVKEYCNPTMVNVVHNYNEQLMVIDLTMIDNGYMVDMMGISTGKPCFYHQQRGFPADFPQHF